MNNSSPVTRHIRLFLILAVALSGWASRGSSQSLNVPPSTGEGVTEYDYEVIHAWPHDPDAFTQGLVFHDGRLLESTGLSGQSSLRKIDWRTGKLLKLISVPKPFFAEGLTVIGDRAYQLTWRHQIGFVYDVVTMQRLGEFTYETEGWGLTTDGEFLILSDGTNRIRFIDPASFAVVRSIDVQAGDKPIHQLNELEFVNGEIFANVWRTDFVVRIDPANGRVRGVINFTDLLPPGDWTPNTGVLNGIAYDQKHDRLIVTGKRWPKLFEVRLIPVP